MDTLVQRKKNQAGTNRIQTKRTKFGNEKRRKKKKKKKVCRRKEKEMRCINAFV